MEELRNSQSYIDAYAKYIKTGKDKEIRAMLTENALEGGQIPVPEFVYDTVKTAWEDSELLRYVRKLYVKGNLKVGFEVSSSGAQVHPEGGDPIQEEELTIGVVELVPEMVKKYVMLSDELEAMASRDFLMYVYDELTHQIALKLETEIINAITNQPVGVTVPEVVNYGTNPKPETIAMSLSKLCAEAKNPVAIMNRGTWGEFKKAQYEANYPIDVFEKLTVIFSDALKSFADAQVNEPYLIVGDFENGFLMNYPEGDEIRIKRDDITLATQDLVRYVGRVYCAMGVIAPRHFVTVNKGDEVTPIVPTGNIEITENGENINVAPYATATVNVSGGGVDLLHTELTIQNESSADFTFAQEDTLLCAGYAVGTEALGSPINFLLTEIIDENDTLGIDFVTKNITIPGNSEVTFMLYYLSPTANCYIIPSLNVESVVNMELDEGAYYLINNASNSSIILSVRK